MPVFAGSLRLAADPKSRVRAEIVVDDERLVVRAGSDELGNWPLSSLTFDPAPGGFRMNADGEELILTTGDNVSFADLVGVSAPPAANTNGQNRDPQPETTRPGAESTRFGQLRSRSAASWVSDDTLHPVLAYVILASALVLIAGAALNWGATRLVGDGAPWSRIFTGAAAIGAAVGAFLAWRQERRVMGAGIAAGAGGITLLILYFYAAEAGLGFGFFLAMIAVVPLTTAAVLGLTSRGIAAEPEKH